MLRYRFDKARKQSGINYDDFKFMDFRAKAGTDKDDNLGIEAAKDQLGHATPATTVQYIRHRLEKKLKPTK